MTDANEALRRIQKIADGYVSEGDLPVMVVIQTICRQALLTDSGYVRVPVEPTIEMLAALGFNGEIHLAIGHANICAGLIEQYKAMLAAAQETSHD